ncbi:MAG: lysine--tRNA ligase [Chromatiales bacterium]|jgi:lysyl-tRNA synthetase class 2|nr:lysine--tRNA ligase [Chromatiales bacterium]
MEQEKDEHDQISQRRDKLKALRERGVAFPADFRRNVMAAELHAEYSEHSAEALEAEPRRVKIAGRMMTRRIMGKAAFAHVQDMSGQIQLYVQREAVSEEGYTEFKKWDIGDIIGAEGVVFKTRAGELSVRVDEVRLLTKALRPLPEKYHGIVDLEMRYRQRYLDLIMNEPVRETFRRRSRIVEFIRRFLTDRGFLEVETPMMQAVPGGATARPFKTHHNALDIPFYMRIAPELYLKRLVVGGFERVFEINRNFRNEGVSTRHNPEFTMLEFYQAYADYHDQMDISEEMLRGLALLFSQNGVIEYQGQRIDFGRPFRRLGLRESILEFNPDISAATLDDAKALADVLRARRIAVKDSYGLGKLQLELFEATVEERLLDPTFITSYPTEVSPLARRNDLDPSVTDRFELFIAGREIANGFTELNDAQDQAERFHDQLKARDDGDDEAMHFDADYIRALEHGMPPTAGQGIGIDRLVMLFTDSASIRDVLLFPHMKPE